jgi:hypothetical protein
MPTGTLVDIQETETSCSDSKVDSIGSFSRGGSLQPEVSESFGPKVKDGSARASRTETGHGSLLVDRRHFGGSALVATGAAHYWEPVNNVKAVNRVKVEDTIQTITIIFSNYYYCLCTEEKPHWIMYVVGFRVPKQNAKSSSCRVASWSETASAI